MHRNLLSKLNLVLMASLALLVSSCIAIPEVVDRVVELVVSGSISEEFHATGIINTHTDFDSVTVDLTDVVDMEQMLDDAGIEPSDADSILLLGAEYRCTVPDPTGTRAIENGNVTIQRDGGVETPLITDFSVLVNTVTAYQEAPLDPAGVAVLNEVLADLLVWVQGDIPPQSLTVTYRVSGDSDPPGVTTDFKWELVLHFNIVGSIEIEMISM